MVQLEMELLDRANSLVERWPDEQRHKIIEGHKEDITALVRLMFEVARMEEPTSGGFAVVMGLLGPGATEAAAVVRKVQAMRVIGEVLFCMGYVDGDKSQLLDMVEVIEEQQEVMKLLLEQYPDGPLKEEIEASAERFMAGTKNVKSMLKFLVRSREREREQAG